MSSPSLLCSSRLSISLLLFWGTVIVYAQRAALSIAIVVMVSGVENEDAAADDDPAGAAPDANSSFASPDAVVQGPHSAKFAWDSRVQGSLLAAFFYGSIVTQIPGGYMSHRLNGKRVYAVGVILTSAMTLLTPVAAGYGVWALWAVRFLKGLSQGILLPTMHGILGRWAPPQERAILTTLGSSGAYAGIILAMPLSSFVCAYVDWSGVFYLLGGMGVAWAGLWMALAADDPSAHPRISIEERDYIVAALELDRGAGDDRKYPTPWRHILTSPRVGAICVANFAYNWCFFTLMTSGPKFMKEVLDFTIKSNGLLLSLPYLLQMVMLIGGGQAADYFKDNPLSTTTVRRICNTVGLGVQAVAVMGLALFGHSAAAAVPLLIVANGFGGLTAVGWYVNPLDVAPDHAGLILGISNCLGTAPGFLGSEIMGRLTHAYPGLPGWRYFFLVSDAVLVAGALVFLFFSSGEVQPWGRRPPELDAQFRCCGDGWGCGSGDGDGVGVGTVVIVVKDDALDDDGYTEYDYDDDEQRQGLKRKEGIEISTNDC